MRPQTEAELAQIVKDASGPLRIRGGGTRGFGLSGAGEVLETGALTGVTLYEPGALTMVVKAGTPLVEIEAALDNEGQRIAFEPMDHRGLLGTEGTPTIGGVVAGNVSGPRRIQAGACRDFMLGLRFVDGRGEVIKNGGRVMKNVTGYDLVKLLTGSWGTLGVLTEVSLKVLPKPDTQACVMIDHLDVPQAVAAMARALGAPYEVTGAAHVPDGPEGYPVTMLRIEGFAGSVAYRAKQLGALFSDLAVRVEQDGARVADSWSGVRDVAVMHGQPGDVWRLSCKPGDAPDLVARMHASQVLLDWGGGLIWARVPAGTNLRARLGSFDGYATRVKGTATGAAAGPVFQPLAAPLDQLSAGLRARFDPQNRLNPGLMTA